MQWCNHWEKESCISILISDTLVSLQQNACVNPGKRIRIPVSGKFLLVESAIFGFGIQNRAQEIRNPTKDWNPESNFHLQRLESTAWNPESKTVLDSITRGETCQRYWRQLVVHYFFYRGCSVLCSCGSSTFIKDHKLTGLILMIF